MIVSRGADIWVGPLSAGLSARPLPKDAIMNAGAIAREKGQAADVAALEERLRSHRAVIGVVGMGYVGQPLAIGAHLKGFRVVGFDTDPSKVAQLNSGRSGIRTIPDHKIVEMCKSGRFRATGALDQLAEPDVLMICVPTPLTKYREPDLTFVEQTASAIAAVLRTGQLICLESTTYPGTTSEVVKPILEAGGLKAGRDFFLAFSPEREDPGNAKFHTTIIPKVVGADDDASRKLANAFYSTLVDRVVQVNSSATAEAVKLTENIFRCVNIALVNELKHIYGRMGINVWDVIDAASTKPFGFMPFYPGPGLGGHCIPIDPFYLTWKAKEYDVPTRFIELAGEVNSAEPREVVTALAEAIDRRQGKGLTGARVLILGLAYKRNVDDMRESPSLKLIEFIEARGATVDYHDPFVPMIPPTRDHAALAGRLSVPLTSNAMCSYDAVLIATDHDDIDYAAVVKHSKLVVDTRNACARLGLIQDWIIKA